MRKFLHTALLLALLLILSACAAKTVRFDGADYRLVQREGDITRYESAPGQVLLVERSADGAQVTADGMVYQVTGSRDETQVTFPDGRELTRRAQGNGSIGLTGVGVEASMADWNRVDDLQALVYGSQPSAPDLVPILFGLLALAAGALQIANPRLAWQIAEGWRYRNLEPSEAYLLISRLAGAVLVIVGVVLLFGGMV